MTDEQRQTVLSMRSDGKTIHEITEATGLWSFSIRRVLKRVVFLQKEHDLRKSRGASSYKCGICGEIGHNRRTHGVQR